MYGDVNGFIANILLQGTLAQVGRCPAKDTRNYVAAVGKHSIFVTGLARARHLHMVEQALRTIAAVLQRRRADRATSSVVLPVLLREQPPDEQGRQFDGRFKCLDGVVERCQKPLCISVLYIVRTAKIAGNCSLLHKTVFSRRISSKSLYIERCSLFCTRQKSMLLVNVVTEINGLQQSATLQTSAFVCTLASTQTLW